MLTVQGCSIEDVKILRPKIFSDTRGFVAEKTNLRTLEKGGAPFCFAQENISYSEKAGTVRGLHYQRPPTTQTKIIEVVHGQILDIAVDLRKDSPTFGQHVAVRLTSDALEMLYVPPGFAHGFCTLCDDVTVVYKLDTFYAPDNEGGLLWNDPALGIDWPVPPEEAVLSEKDKKLPLFQDFVPLEW